MDRGGAELAPRGVLRGPPADHRRRCRRLPTTPRAGSTSSTSSRARVVIETERGDIHDLADAETIVIPAAVGGYRVRAAARCGDGRQGAGPVARDGTRGRGVGPRDLVAVLDVGGTHVAGAVVDLGARAIVDGTRSRRDLDPHGSADAVLGAIVGLRARRDGDGGGAASRCRDAGPVRLRDGDRAVRRGGQVRRAQRRGRRCGAPVRAGAGIRDVVFVNDADAFAFGEGPPAPPVARSGPSRSRSGPGSAPRSSTTGRSSRTAPGPAHRARAWKIVVDGVPLEERCSRRAILRAAAGHPALAPPGRRRARPGAGGRSRRRGRRAVFDDAFDALGRGLGPWLARFEATMLAVGGSIAGSWTCSRSRWRVAWPGGERRGTARPPRDARDDAALLGAAIASFDRARDPEQDATCPQPNPDPPREQRHGRHDPDGSVRRARARAQAERGADARRTSRGRQASAR